MENEEKNSKERISSSEPFSQSKTAAKQNFHDLKILN